MSKLKLLVGIVGHTDDLVTPFTKEVETVAPDNLDFKTERILFLNENFFTLFKKLNCHACLISPISDVSILEKFDMLVIPGGPDVPPEFYGQQAHPETYLDPYRIRDVFEKQVIEYALKIKKPILSICRGFQLVNVVKGGALHQHLPDLSSDVRHRSAVSPTAYEHPVHTTRWLQEIVGKELLVNSWHHQGIDSLGKGLVPLAQSPDGIVEAYESSTNEPPILGVQWHPEILQDKASIDMLTYFIEKYVLTFNRGRTN